MNRVVLGMKPSLTGERHGDIDEIVLFLDC
jgi:hypothetical protein